MPKISQLTAGYIADHPAIMDCLAMDTINYSKLARQIRQELGIDASKVDAIIVACRRYAAGLRKLKKRKTGMDVLRKSRKAIKIANKKATIMFTINEKYLAMVLDLLK
jgi:intein-encoded DNA endonuclease-like protein